MVINNLSFRSTWDDKKYKLQRRYTYDENNKQTKDDSHKDKVNIDAADLQPLSIVNR